MRHGRWWCGVGLAVALAVGAGPAAADDGALALTYQAPEVCPDEFDLRAEVAARRPGTRFAVDGAVVAIVQVRDAREGFVAELTVIEPGAAATTRLYPPVDHCLVATARLADALAGFLADQPAPATAPGVTPVELGLRGPGGSPGPGTAPRSGWRR